MKAIRIICAVGILGFVVIFCVMWQGLSNTPSRLMPENGLWYCDELQIQLSFDDYNKSYAIVDGEKIKCAVGNDRGSDIIMISCQELYSEVFRLDETILEAVHIKLTDTYWIVEDNDGNEYLFERIA